VVQLIESRQLEPTDAQADRTYMFCGSDCFGDSVPIWPVDVDRHSGADLANGSSSVAKFLP
jgi:hypothetical protein